MTIEITVTCDTLNCCRSVSLDDYHDVDIDDAGFHVDDRTGFHYCAKCWPVVKKEIERQNS